MSKFRCQVPNALIVFATAVLAWTTPASAANITVKVENLAPLDGTYITPVGIFFHDGTFDLGSVGSAASAALERAAEDGNLDPLFALYDASGSGTARGAVFGPGGVFAPGDIGSAAFVIDPSQDRYLSFVSMVIPSNDAFIFNDNPLAYPLFDAGDAFQAPSIIIGGDGVYDAGTEVNDEIPANTPLLGQTVPDTGVTEGGVIGMHPGFLENGNVLAAIPAGDFTQEGYPIAIISAVPIPAALPLFIGGLGVLVMVARHRRATPAA